MVWRCREDTLIMKKQLGELVPKLFSIFNHLHEHPEVSWQERETTQFIAQILRQEGFRPQLFKDCTGLYVDIGEGIPRVGIRADIDALWQEVNGVMCANHSCGHDGHMTMAIGVLLLLKQLQVEGAVRVIFQPAEEKGSGALKMIQLGIVEPLQYLFSVHVRPVQELADGHYSPALYHGATKTFLGEIVGEDTHAARPHLGQNAIEVGAGIVQALTLIHHDPMVPTSYKLTKFHAGTESTNIIPGKAEFAIDVRAQRNDAMEQVGEQILYHMAAVARLYGVKIHIKEVASIVAAEVDMDALRIMEQAILETVGKVHLHPPIHTPGGEDFHHYAMHHPKLKATMLGLGCGLTPGLHHPQMTFNTERLVTGVEILVRTVISALQSVKNEGAEDYVRVSNSERIDYN